MPARLIGASLGVGALLSGITLAQIAPSPTPITMPTTESLLGPIAPGAPPPSTDPRDLNGIYQPEVQVRPELGGPGASRPREPSGTAPPDRPRAPAAGAGPANPTASMLCVPDAHVGFGGDINQIIQLPDRILFIEESNHIVRRVYLNKDFPAMIVPSYAGTSIGHWDGDTLEIETRGLKGTGMADGPPTPGGVASITRVVERVRKLEGGRTLEDSAVIEALDRAGMPVQLNRTVRDRWRSDLRLMESICEDGAVVFFSNSGT
jgi:hypothetical protein